MNIIEFNQARERCGVARSDCGVTMPNPHPVGERRYLPVNETRSEDDYMQT